MAVSLALAIAMAAIGAAFPSRLLLPLCAGRPSEELKSRRRIQVIPCTSIRRPTAGSTGRRFSEEIRYFLFVRRARCCLVD